MAEKYIYQYKLTQESVSSKDCFLFFRFRKLEATVFAENNNCVANKGRREFESLSWLSIFSTDKFFSSFWMSSCYAISQKYLIRQKLSPPKKKCRSFPKSVKIAQNNWVVREEKNTVVGSFGTVVIVTAPEGPFLTSPLGANFDHRGEVIPWGWNSLFAPSILLNSRECSPWLWTKGWTFPLGDNFQP
jgi:hypothetical protein